ncbi:hypothetical protein QFZ68_006872 [Streptomyces sp. V1I6]|nr:hypothetical protein [Streptomyces sp. V1I6]
MSGAGTGPDGTGPNGVGPSGSRETGTGPAGWGRADFGSGGFGETGTGLTGFGPGGAGPIGSQWYDAEAGPLVRPYAMTGGRTRPGPSNVRFDLIALVVVDTDGPGPEAESLLGPEHRVLLTLCRCETQSVAELAADADLPVGVVRVLLGDLLEAGFVKVRRPVPPAQLPDERILREVIEGLRAL